MRGLELHTALWATLQFMLHVAPMLDQPCKLDPGPVQIGPTDWLCMPDTARRADVVQASHVACALDQPHVLYAVTGQGQHMLPMVLGKGGGGACSAHISLGYVCTGSRAGLDEAIQAIHMLDRTCRAGAAWAPHVLCTP